MGFIGSELLGSELHATVVGGGSEVDSDSQATSPSLLRSEGSGFMARGVRAVGPKFIVGLGGGFPRRFLCGLDLYRSLGVNSAVRLSRFVSRGVKIEGSGSRVGF